MPRRRTLAINKIIDYICHDKAKEDPTWVWIDFYLHTLVEGGKPNWKTFFKYNLPLLLEAYGIETKKGRKKRKKVHTCR